MAEEDDAAEGEVEDGAAASDKGRKAKRLITFIAVPVLLVLAIGAGLYFSGIAQSLLGHGGSEEKKAEAAPPKEPVYYDLDDMLVNLNTGTRKASFLKLSVSLQLASKDDIPKVKAVLPRITDAFQVYLRELRLEDLRGGAGLYRLREELLDRVNAAMAPDKIDDVLFRELLVQ